ncbi:MAG: hypothetical protein LBK74_11890 [Treponema sp.]|nr:hypothetical protein [Treponema sp.]
MTKETGGTAYKTLVSALKRQTRGITVADIAAKTALPLERIRDLIPRAADEYNARLQVSESGEILYSFPRGFTSRYRGFGPALGRFFEKAAAALKVFFAAVFKVWIMVMLVGYFVLFFLITLAALVFAAAASSSGKDRDRRSSGGPGNGYVLSRMMNMVLRFWFYRSIMNTGYSGGYGRGRKAEDERPLYKKVFSFVFGDGDPNKGWAQKEAMELIGYIRKKNGVISLPEFVIRSGLDFQRAEREILAYCVNYGGMPEATEDGTVVYRFDSLLPGSEKDSSRDAPSLKGPWKFSANKDGLNAAFALINAVNLGFGGYFLYFALNPAAVNVSGFSYLFHFVYGSLAGLGVSPLAPVAAGLGVVPVLFSLFFWIVPAVRRARIKKKNAAIDFENRRKQGFAAVWDAPLEVTEDLFGKDAGRLIREIGSYSVPDVVIDSRGKTVYSFKELDEEKKALEKYRRGIDKNRGDPGAVVFDSDG